MFEHQNKKQFHAHWLIPGSHTLLQELAPSQSLFLIEQCDTLLLDCIFQKCNVQALSFNEDESNCQDSGNKDYFFYGFGSSLSCDNSIADIPF